MLKVGLYTLDDGFFLTLFIPFNSSDIKMVGNMF